MQLFLFEGWEKIILIDYGHVAYFSNVQISIVFEFCGMTSKVISPLAQSSEVLSYNLNLKAEVFRAWPACLFQPGPIFILRKFIMYG